MLCYIIFGFGIRVFAENEVEAQWIMKNDLPTQLAGSAVAEANGKIYVFGGISSSLTDTKKTVYEYDPINDSWVKKMICHLLQPHPPLLR
ncbi:hypothetical protein [Paenibacillus polymyxa]|uniref:hypothetical protein n=1 Tax=Paenibacillus polymyxa TaxID=1406 RepID=UPI003B67A2E3